MKAMIETGISANQSLQNDAAEPIGIARSDDVKVEKALPRTDVHKTEDLVG